jgi:transketolase
VAWKHALERRDGPSALLFTRQNVPFTPRSGSSAGNVERGGYVVADFSDARPRAVVIATGSEVQLALRARELLADDIAVRVVSMPCTQAFDRQDAAYRRDVLPHGIPRVAVEAGTTDGWHKYTGAVDDPRSAIVGIDRYGESAPAPVLFRHFGFTPVHVADAVRRVVAARG